MVANSPVPVQSCETCTSACTPAGLPKLAHAQCRPGCIPSRLQILRDECSRMCTPAGLTKQAHAAYRPGCLPSRQRTLRSPSIYHLPASWHGAWLQADHHHRALCSQCRHHLPSGYMGARKPVHFAIT
eukprot:scaffold65772_cov19-Tisochrysis_lutea.AAC.1